MRRDEFTLEEYRKLHTVGRKWIAEADKPASVWYRTVTYNMILIACNPGMRPSEMKNLRWRDIMPAKDREGREIVVLFVQGKGKSRKLVAPKSVGDYLERIRTISKATEQEDRVFCRDQVGGTHLSAAKWEAQVRPGQGWQSRTRPTHRDQARKP
jgi:integrase